MFVESPTQSFPPNQGPLHVRFCEVVPFPQVALHSLQSSQSPHCPSALVKIHFVSNGQTLFRKLVLIGFTALKLKLEAVYSLPIGQSIMKQLVVFVESPSQSLPPYNGPMHVRFCDVVPFPQVALHMLQSSQSPHSPSF